MSSQGPSGSASFAWQAWDNVHCQGVGCTPWRPSGSASFAWQVWDNVSSQGVGCTPWRPSGSASFAWQAWDNVHCQGVGCTPWRPSGSASFAWQAWASAAFAWQAWDNVHCQGVRYTLWQAWNMFLLTRSLTHLLYLNIHTHKLTHHHRSITLMLPLPFLLFYAQSKSREVGNMWGYPAL